MKRSQLAINSISVRGTLEGKLEAFSLAGFRGVEFVLSDIKEFLSNGHDIKDVRRLLLRHELVCIGGFEVALAAFDEATAREQNHQRIVDNAKLLSELGASKMVVGTDGPPADSTLGATELMEHLAQSFASIAPRVARFGVELCLEFNWSPIVKTLHTACAVMRRANEITGLQNMGVLFDPAHYHCTPTKFEHLTPENIALIKHVHVNDMRDIPGELCNCNSDRTLPLQGCLDLRALYGAMENGGYGSWFSIEMFSEELWSKTARQASQAMYQSLLPLCEA
jgi:sugar phosphate isomerase/epimerase